MSIWSASTGEFPKAMSYGIHFGYLLTGKAHTCVQFLYDRVTIPKVIIEVWADMQGMVVPWEQ